MQISINHSTLAYVCHYPGADCHQSSTIPPWPMCVTIQVQTATSHQPFHPGLCVSLSRCRLPPVINHSTLAYVCHYPGADCHQSSTIPPWPMCVTIQVQTATSHQPFHPGLCVSLSRCRLPPVINHSTLAYVCHYPGADCHQSSTIPPWPMCVTIQVQTATSHQPFHPGLCVSLSRCRLPPVINHSTLAYVCHYPGADCHQSSTIPPWPMCVTIQVQTATSHQPFHPGLCVSLSRVQTATSHQPFHPGLCVSLSRCRLPPVINHSTLAYVCHYPGADCHQSSTIPPWPMCVTIQVQTATSHQPFHPGLCVSLSRCRLPPVINHSTLAYVCHYPGADCHQSSTIPPWPMCVTIQVQTATSHQPFHPGLCVSLSRVQTATSHQPFHPGLCVSLSRCRLPPVINHSTLAYVCHYPGCRLPPVINHSTLAYVCHYPGADCHQSSTIPPWPMCVTIQVQTATSHQPFHPGLCVSLSRCRLPPVINHSTLAYVCHYPGADCHQSSTIPPWPMCVTIQGQTATSHQPFHPGLCVSLSRCRLPPVINHSTLAYVCHYPGADCHQSSTIPPWPMCVTIQVQTATSHQPFHPGLCACHYPGADCHQSSTIPPWPMCVTRLPPRVQTATSHQPFHPGLCVSHTSRLPPVINHSTLAYVCHYPGADCHQSSTIPPWPMCVTIQGQTATSHQPFHPGLCVSLSRVQTATSHQPFHPGLCVSLSRCRLPPVINHSTLAYVCHYPGCRLPPVINHSTLAYVCHYPGADCHQSSTIPPWPMCVTIQGSCHQSSTIPPWPMPLSRCRLPPVINHSTLAYVCHYPGADCHQSSTIPPWPMCVTIQGHADQSSTIPPWPMCHYPGADCHQSSTIPPWPMCVTIQGQTATSHQPFHPGITIQGADCHQSSTIPPWPMCVTIQGQTATSHQPFHPGLCVSLSRCRLPPVINHSTLAYVCHYPGQTATSHQPFHPGLCVSLSRCRLPPVINHSTLAYVCHYPGQATRLPPVINHSTLAYVCHYPGADCHQSSTIPPWPMCVTIQVQTATSHQPFHPGLCVSLSRCRLPPVINHSTLAYVCHYPGADCHQSSTIPPWPMCVTIQGQTATSHQPFHPGLCVSLSRCRLPPVINHSTLAYVCHYPGADCHQSSTIPPWPMCVTIQVQTATSHQPFHPGLCVSLSRGRLPPVINHSTLAYVCHYPGQTATSHQPFHPATIQVQTATSHQPFHPGLCVSLSRCRLPPVINHSTLAYVCHYPGADCHQSSAFR